MMDKETFEKMAGEMRNASNEIKEELKRLYQDVSVALEREMKVNPVLVYSIFIAVFIVFVTTILLCCLRGRKTIRNSILLLGLSDSGKTLLFSKLVSAKQVTTYTSMKENVASVIPPDQKTKKVTLIDIPGNERLRFKYLDKYLTSARGIIYVVDSLTFQKDIRDVASFLYSIFQERFVRKYGLPVLVVCNKQDHAVAKSAKIIQSQLEKEMNALRQTQTGQLNATSPEEETVFLGQKGKDFQFSDLKPTKVSFVECSALETPEDVTDPSEILPNIWTWIAKVA